MNTTFKSCALFGLTSLTALVLGACGSSGDAVREEAYADLSGAQAAEYGELSNDQIDHFNERLKEYDAALNRHEGEIADGIRAQLVQSAIAYEAALINAISDTGNPRARATAAFMLGFLGKGESALTLANIMADSGEPSFIRNRASIGLAMMGSGINSANPTDRDAIMATLARMMLTKHAAPSVRTHAVMAYARAFDPRRDDSINPLRSALVEDYSNEVRIQTLLVLGDLGISALPAVPDIDNALRDSDVNIRATAAQALGNIPHRAAYSSLAQATEDQSGRVRRDAIYSIVGQKSVNAEGVRERIIRGLSDTDETVRAAAASAAGKMGDSALVRPLLSSLSDDASQVRIGAIQSLGNLVTKEDQMSAIHLVFSLDDGNVNIRNSALSALKKITGETISADSDAWRKWFYAKYPDQLDPDVVYKDQVKPRYFSDGVNPQGGMNRNFTRPNSSSSRTTRNNTNRNTTRNNNSARRR